MAFPHDVDATWVNPEAVAYDAGELRRADAAMYSGLGSALGVAGGVVRHGDTSLSVTVDASDVVTVQPGAVVIPGNAVAGSGCYRAALGNAVTGSLDARHATNSRIDLIVFRQMDTDVVGAHAAYTGRIDKVTGTASPTPSAPALPSMAVELGRVTVPATGGGTGTVDSTYRTYATGAGGILAVHTEARLPASAPLYMRAVVLGTGREYFFNGSTWTKIVERPQAGRATCNTPAATTRYTQAVTFATAFAVAPVVTLAPEVTGPETVFATPSSVTTTGFTLNWYRTIGSANFTCGWAATPVS